MPVEKKCRSRRAGSVVPCLGRGGFFKRLQRMPRPYQSGYYAMYSSIPDGIVTDPDLMTVPFDDHMVNRGDGVFEVFLCVDGAIYNLEDHLDRLKVSAAALAITMPFDMTGIIDRILATVRAGGQRNCTVRINVSRGPGGFGVDPAEAVAPQLYIVAYRLPAPFMSRRPGGATAATLSKPLRHFTKPVVKSCNYLFNVMMKLEAAERGVDFALAKDSNGFFAEGATESMACVTRRGELLFPRPGHILRGTTAGRACVLARKLVREGLLKGIRRVDCSPQTIRSAAELMLFGTTITVAPVVRFDGRKIGAGRPGPVARALFSALENDMRHNTGLRTPAWR